MRTRILHTKIYFEDDWFYELSTVNKFLFIYLITNSHVGLSGIYELADRVAITETGVPKIEYLEAKEAFKNKIGFYEDWVYIIHANRYALYRGEKNEKALIKELSLIPYRVFKAFNDTVSIPYVYPMDTTINHKSEIINHKSEIGNIEKFRKSLEKKGILKD